MRGHGCTDDRLSRPARLLFAGSGALVLYAFAGYPAIVALLARARPRPVRSDPASTPHVSLIVLAYDEAEIIEDKLRGTLALDYPPERLEVLVVTDGSRDGTPERARRVPGVRVLHDPRRGGKLAAMNRGRAEARGEILVFSDANNRYSRDALRALVAPFADPEVGVVTGRKAIDDGSGRPLDRAEGLYWRYESRLKAWESAIGSVTGVAGEILAFRREAYRSPRLGTMNEDFVQAMLAAVDGWRVVYARDAVSLERASATLGDEATRRSRLVTGRWQALSELMPRMVRSDPRLAWQVISHKGLRPLVPGALLGLAAGCAPLVRRSTVARAAAAGQVVFYAGAVVGWNDARRGRRRRWSYLPYFFCRMNAASLQGLRDFVTGRREAVWARVQRG
jgi:cellulose synthase/poly-beta-1,6-N-acetylglucosamine synthase-like glycosyltransferase